MTKLAALISQPLVWLSLILIVGFWVRLYRIDVPLGDWHSWRQADTAAVARNFFQEGFNPFLPRYDDMSGVAENPVPNPERYRFVEFPIYGSLVYLTYLINGDVDLRLARLVTIVISLGSTIFVYLLAKRFFGVVTAILSAMIFALLPFNVYFSRTILPDPLLVFFSLGMFYFLERWIWENKLNQYLASVLLMAGAFLTKPMAIFYLLPLIYSYFHKEGRWWPIPARYFKVLIPGILPLLLWRIWIAQHPEGIPSSSWLFNGTGIRFRPAFFRWIIGERFGQEILGVAGSLLFFLGLLIRPIAKTGWLIHLLALSMFAYLIIFATGNVTHDYYQIMIVPPLAILTARGVVLLFSGIANFLPRLWTIPLAILMLILTFYLPWLEVRGLYQINNGVINLAGDEARKILPKEAVVVAPYNGDTTLLYQIDRPGWPQVFFPIADHVGKFGATHYVSVTRDPYTAWVMRKYTVLVETNEFVIVDLTRENPHFDSKTDQEPAR